MNVIPIALVGILAAMLAVDKRYEDGLVRHSSLAVIVIAAFVMVFGDWSKYEFPPELTILLWAYAVFFICHAYSYIRWRTTGSHDWNKKKAKQ